MASLHITQKLYVQDTSAGVRTKAPAANQKTTA